MALAVQSASSRLGFLDWTRGLAAVIMLQGHVFHSFTTKNLRDSGPYVLSQFIGGITPAVFLFLTGVTLAFLMESREKQGVGPLGRVFATFGRARYLATIAILFRLQLCLFGYPQTNWTDVFKVDVLNSMALAVAVMALFAAIPATARVRAAGFAGLAIAAVSPLVSMADVRWMHPFVASYFVPDYNQFSFFPWAAFVAFGVSAGTLLRILHKDALPRIMQWSAVSGFGLIFIGQYFGNLPYSFYEKSEFWLNSPALIVIKLGVILVIAAAAYLWNLQPAVREWSWVRQLGTTSLIVYWVHIELVYGRWFGSWKESLPVAQTAAVAVVLIALMLALSLAQAKWKRSDVSLTQSFREFFAEAGLASRRRVSGD
jgi:uncharacterized membrane protein